MAKSIPALINPAMLKWAREKSRLTVDQAADGIGVAVEKLEASEAGEGHLTFPQFLKAANLYKRAPSIFYLENPPTDYQPVRDFRRLPDLFDAGFSPKLATALREAQERRDLALELYKDLNEPLAPFDLSGAITDNVEELAGKIRRALGVTQATQITWRAKAFDNWRLAIESKDVLVFMVPSLPLSDMRGAAFASPTLPMILINSKDRTNGRTFTLLHEFCHLVLRASGVSGFGADEGSSYESHVERFCNATAAATLVPKDWLLSEPLVVRKGPEMIWQNEELQALAVRFGVSREVVLRRLLTIGRTSRAFYERCRPMFQKEYDDLEEKASKGGPKQHFVVLSRFGRAYTRLVLQGYHERQLTLRDVAGHLNMQVKNVPAVERAAFGLGA